MARQTSKLLALLVLLGLGRSEAAFVTYTETATASGTLGSSTYTNASITITGTADTTNVTAPFPGIFTVLTSTTVTIAGLGTATFTDVIQALDNQGGDLAGFGDVTNNSIVLGNANVAFATYDLQSSIGPDSGPSSIDGLFASFNTTSGKLAILSASNASFTATVAAATVPEPVSVGMMALGLGLATTWRRTRKRVKFAL